MGTSLFCGPNKLVSPDAAHTHLYADGVHPTYGAHAAIADYALSIILISAGTVIGQLAPIASQTSLKQMHRIDRRLVIMPNSEQGVQRWATGKLWVNTQAYYADLNNKVNRYVHIISNQLEHHSRAGGYQLGGRISIGYDWLHELKNPKQQMGVSLITGN